MNLDDFRPLGPDFHADGYRGHFCAPCRSAELGGGPHPGCTPDHPGECTCACGLTWSSR